ncbi:hypothetical protein BsWGS_02211 [Bradybaena similaris]
MATKILTVTGLVDDNILYCEDCNQEYTGDCPKHGPLLVVNDTEAPASCPRGSDLGYSRATLPEGLIIKKSRIPKAGLGVFALKDFPTRSRFGPYEGREERDEDVAQDSGYCWQIIKDGKHSHYLDGKKPSESNWMRFVNCARSEDEQSVTAFQYQGNIYFRAHRHIFAGNEMLVYYGDSYAKDLGIRIQRVGNFSRKPNTEEVVKEATVCEEHSMHFCAACFSAFSKLDDIQKHIAKLTEEKKMADYVYGQKKNADRNESGIDSNTNKLAADINSQSNKVICVCQKNLKLQVNEKGCIVCNRSELPISKDTEDAAYNCDVCGVEFNSNGYLQIHKVNLTDRPFKCNVCDLTFFRSGNLEAHKRKHTGEMPYKCDTCNERFSDRSVFLRHRSQHAETKTYRCDICNERFATSTELFSHRSSLHTEEKPYKCNICGMAFAQSAHLHIHERKHTREKQYKCDVCGLEFAHSGNLNSHKRIHTGEKPYKCDQCSADFTHCANLQAHKSHAHPNKDTI